MTGDIGVQPLQFFTELGDVLVRGSPRRGQLGLQLGLLGRLRCCMACRRYNAVPAAALTTTMQQQHDQFRHMVQSAQWAPRSYHSLRPVLTQLLPSR